MLGEVTRVDEEGVFVELPHLAAGYEVGPVLVPGEEPLSPGDKVAVEEAELGDDYVVLAARLTTVAATDAGQARAFRHDQDTPAAVWTISHGLSFVPGGVRVFDSSGDRLVGDVAYPDDGTVTVSFTAPFAGQAYLS